MSRVSFGVGLFETEAPARTLQLSRTAEAVGFDSIWVGDSNMIWREVYVLLGAIATQTSRLALCTGVTHPEVRHPAVIASAMVTLAELAGERVRLGIGIGGTGPANLGLPVVPVGELKKAIVDIRGLTRGETVDLGGYQGCIPRTLPGTWPLTWEKLETAGFKGRISYAHHNIPIYVGAGSEKTLRMAAAVADGVITSGTAWDPLPDRLARLRSEEQRVGRPPGSIKALCWTPCSIASNPVEALRAVKAMVANQAAGNLGLRIRRGLPVSEEDRVAWERITEHYDTMQHMTEEHAALVPDRWMKYVLFGTAEQVREQVKEIVAQGWQEIGIIPFGKDREAIVRAFGEQVIQKL